MWEIIIKLYLAGLIIGIGIEIVVLTWWMLEDYLQL